MIKKLPKSPWQIASTAVAMADNKAKKLKPHLVMGTPLDPEYLSSTPTVRDGRPNSIKLEL